MTKSIRISLVIAATVAAAVVVLILAEPFIPARFGFHSDDPVAQARYEDIVKSHGYQIRYERNVRGGTVAWIDEITPRNYKSIHCEYYAWSTRRDRAKGIVVLDREDCAL